MPQVKITTRGARRIRNGHLWVYLSDLRQAADAEGGDMVRVIDDARNFVGRAFYSDASEICLRFLTTRDETIDREWWRLRLRECAERRQAIARETNAYRLVYSEGDLLPSFIVDVYDEIFVVQTLSQGTDRLKSTLVELLVEQFKPRAVIERNDARVREFEGLELRAGILWSVPAESRRVGNGALDDRDISGLSESKAPSPLRSAGALHTEISQHGVRFFISPLSGQKTGAFLDQRENYLAARRVAHGRALDCFTFNGGFALHIASACDSVLGIDISPEAIAGAQQNAELNDTHNVEFRVANVFDVLREIEASGERFDTIILDPPAFAKNRASLPSAARGYKEINLRALKILNPGGVLVTCTCSYHVSEPMFLETIANAALDARRRVQIIEKRGQSSDHPVLLGVPETHYLKCIVTRAID